MKPLIILALTAASAFAQSTISDSYKHSWGANIGWTNWKPSGADGVRVTQYTLSGWIWAANVGWIHLGDGTPDNGVQYSNATATDYGVNLMPGGLLRGYAWCPNAGWLNFEATGNPRLTYQNGDSYGYVWSANMGWINLDSNFSYIITNTIEPGVDSDGDGIADAWEREQGAGSLGKLTATGDYDGDGVSDLNEYLADTNPFSASTNLRITDYQPNVTTGAIQLTWTSSARRSYAVEYRDNLTAGTWLDIGLGFTPGDAISTTRTFLAVPAQTRFHRVSVKLPLAP